MTINANLMRASILVALGVAGAAGCADGGKPAHLAAHEEFFIADGESKVRRIADVQADRGAAEDATLQPHHFSGPRLNSLGEQKLQQLLTADIDADVVVYLNINGALADTRSQAVTSFLTEQGVDASHIKLERGSNPNLSAPSALGQKGLPHTETVGASGIPSDQSMQTEMK